MSMKWRDMESIYNVHKAAIYDIDEVTGLPVSLLAAAGPDSDLESVYRLCRECRYVRNK